MSNKHKYYEDANPNPSFSDIENNILQFWGENNTFQKSIDNRKGEEEFIFYDGPPFANGLPHYGHLLTGYVKDVFARYQTMLGKKVERNFGWDCHGLPAEMGAEKGLEISGRAAIMDYGIDKFNDKCREDVMKYAGEWEQYVNRQARWVDFERDYKTMDKSFMESVMWAFGELYKKGLIYEAQRVMPYSWAAETPLSNFETRLDNSYRERKDKAVFVPFELDDGRKLIAWTTTPWTLPSNLALAVNPDMQYAVKGEYVFGKFAVSKIGKELGIEEGEELKSIKGSELVGHSYKPLLPYFADHPNSFKVLAADFVEEGEGTGIVHIAPGFGEDDQAVGEAAGIELVCPVDNAGKFTAEVSDYEGLNVFDANEKIIQRLKDEGKLIKQEQYIHNYPHCWRTDEPLIYKALPSWYVEVTKFKDRMVELNKDINWIPGHIRDGLFGKWLENARDWSISRNRFWGAPIPIWRSPSGKLLCFGSIEELEKASGQKVEDLHRPYIDKITIEKDGELYTRVEDVLDCWFESGSMPFASQASCEKPSRYPADFIVEYTAQTRGWFYTMMVLSTALFDEAPFKNCICHGVVLDDQGQKLSKRLNNYPDPLKLFEEYGSDALRWFMLSSPIMRGAELHIDKEGKFIRDIIRLYIKPIWNAYNFFTLYANADGIEAKESLNSENLMDKYILAKCASSIAQIRRSMDEFDTPGAYEAIEQFFEVLNNWYIRRSKDRFWSEGESEDKQAAYDTLFTVLVMMCQAAAPLLPLVTEEIFKKLMKLESVHLERFPDMLYSEPELEQKMDKVRDVCNAALSIRSAQNIRVRQPLQSLKIVGYSEFQDLKEVIKDEINVKEILFESSIARYGEAKLKINFPVLGKRLPEKMKQIIPASKKGEWKVKDKGLEICGEYLQTEEYKLLLEPKNKDNSAPLSSQDALVVLDLELTDELIEEGLARDAVRLIQQARKDADLNISDRIDLVLETTAEIKNFSDYIAEQTLAKSVEFEGASNKQHKFNNKLGDSDITIAFSVAS